MDDHEATRGRSPSANPFDINQSQSPSINAQPDPSLFAASPNANFDFGSTYLGPEESEPPLQTQTRQFLSADLNSGDFSLFPTDQDPYGSPLFDSFNPSDMNAMASPAALQTPTSPQLFHLDGVRHQIPVPVPPAYLFSSPPHPRHARNVSLGPEAALLPSQLHDWSQPQFQGHRRTPSEYSDVSSVAPSPHLVSSDTFNESELSGHSPLQRPSEGVYYQEEFGIGGFSLADHGSPAQHGRSPSHSPAVSPRIVPQNNPADPAVAPSFNLIPPNDFGYIEAFPALPAGPVLPAGPDASHIPMAPPAINIDYAPTKPGDLEPSKQMDQDSLTPNRGRISRPRSVTDPFHQIVPSLGSNSVKSDARSLSPLDRQPHGSSRRRQSTSSVPNNVIALRLADPEYQGSQDSGAAKRTQKHPATFQCTLCPKRFTRAYNLRSHLRTHTDERPFVCTVCGKAFARQHDRKRHESLHSGEKKFVCKGDLKAGGLWGCGRRFARADALGRHFRSEAGRICIKPLLDEEMIERQRQWQEQRMRQEMSGFAASQGQPPMSLMDAPTAYPVDASGQYALPAALLAQYPALAQMNWSTGDLGGGLDDELSGRSSFDASDYDDGDDGGYISGSGYVDPGGVPHDHVNHVNFNNEYGG